MERILIIPANTTESLDEYFCLKTDKNHIIGASSVDLDFSSGIYDQHYKIPWITEENFTEKINNIIEQEKITKVVCTHLGIYRVIKNNIPDLEIKKPDVKDSYGINKEGLEIRAAQHHHYISEKISLIELASLLDQFSHIPGNCSEDKFTELVNAGSSSPEGDFIEIGSFYGKSAFVLGWAAKHKNSKLLCIDPWEKNTKSQIEAHSTLKLRVNNRIVSAVKKSFILNLYLYLNKTLNYFQGYSDDAFEIYKEKKAFSSLEFGVSKLQNKIACLHIDGNHDYQYVKSDIVKWSQYLLPGAWMIIDDYHWCYGNGPKLAADEFLQENINKIEKSYFCGGALFIQMKS